MSTTIDVFTVIGVALTNRPRRRSEWTGINMHVPADYETKFGGSRTRSRRRKPARQRISASEIQERQAALHHKYADIDIQLPPQYRHLIEDKPKKTKTTRARR